MFEFSRERARSQTSPKAKVKVRGKEKKTNPGTGNENQDQAGSPDEETGQRKLMNLVQSVKELNLLVLFQSTMIILRHTKWIEQLMCFGFKSAKVT